MGLSCALAGAAFAPMLNLLLTVFDVANRFLWLGLWGLLGVGAWSTFALLAIGVRIRAASRGVEVSLGPGRRIRVDHAVVELPDAYSVDVVPHLIARYEVVVRNEARNTLWRLSGLRATHARCLAIDLSSGWGLYASPALGRVEDLADAHGAKTEFRTGVHDVRIRVWSRSVQSTSLTAAIAGVLPAFTLLANPVFGCSTAPFLLVASMVLYAALMQLYPVRIDLSIGPDGLVVRNGAFWPREDRIPVAALHPPRIVPDGPNGASLILRSDTGWLCEIRGRPREELDRIAWWVEHARTEGTKALPEPPPEMPAELARIREQIPRTT